MTLDQFLLTGRRAVVSGPDGSTVRDAFSALFDGGANVVVVGWEDRMRTPGFIEQADILVHCSAQVLPQALESELERLVDAARAFALGRSQPGRVLLAVVEARVTGSGAAEAESEVGITIRRLALELAVAGVRANAIVVAPIPSAPRISSRDGARQSGSSRGIHDLTGAVLFLTSDAASFLSGELLRVDGELLGAHVEFEPSRGRLVCFGGPPLG